MTFLSKPSWYGKPIVTRDNVPVILRSLAMILTAAFVVSMFALFAAWKAPEEDMLFPIQAFVGTAAILSLVVGWFLALFFCFRMAVNFIRAATRRRDSFRYWSLKRLYQPFYGFRDQDLTDEGLRHRRLGIEGFFGFLAINGFIWFWYFMSLAVGIEY